MASRYFRFCHSGLYRELKVTISNDLVSRSKRPLDDFEEGQQALQPDVKRQRCGSPFPSQKTSLAPVIPSFANSRIAGSQVYSQFSNGDGEDSDSLLACSDEESPDSPFSGTLEDEERLLADSETDTNDVVLGVSVEEVDSGFAAVSFQVSQQQSVPKAPSASLEPLLLTVISVPTSSVLPHSSAPANPGRGSNTNVDSHNQTGLGCSPNRLELQDVMSTEAGSSSPKKEVNGSGIVDEAATQMVGEDSPVESQLTAKCEFASVVTDRPSDGQPFIHQSEVEAESTCDPPCETQRESDIAREVATEHFIAPNKDRAEGSGPEEPNNPSPEESSSDGYRRTQIFIPGELLHMSKEKYIEGVLAHAQHKNIIGPVNELRELMRKVATEYHSQEPNHRHSTDLTVRNYALRAKREIQKCSLEMWVTKNKPNFRRFAKIPDKFKRSPIPSR